MRLLMQGVAVWIKACGFWW